MGGRAGRREQRRRRGGSLAGHGAGNGGGCRSSGVRVGVGWSQSAGCAASGAGGRTGEVVGMEAPCPAWWTPDTSRALDQHGEEAGGPEEEGSTPG